MCAVCTDCALLTRFSAFYYDHGGCFGGFNHCLDYCLWHALFSCHLPWFSLDCLVWDCLYLLYFSCLCVRLIRFYFWHNVMLHWRKMTPLIACIYVVFSSCLMSLWYLTIYVQECIYLQSLYVQMELYLMGVCVCYWCILMMCSYRCIYVIVHDFILILQRSWEGHFPCQYLPEGQMSSL